MPTRTSPVVVYFFFTAPAPTGTYTLSLHDALPICRHDEHIGARLANRAAHAEDRGARPAVSRGDRGNDVHNRARHVSIHRSEERRVGKEWSTRWWPVY